MTKNLPTDGKRPRKKRTARPFPTSTFEEALEIALSIQKYSGGLPIRRLTLFDHLGKSPDSSASRQLITNSGKYGLTKGSYAAETLELTPDGTAATSEESSPRERCRTRVKLAIQAIVPFNVVYERFAGNKLPSGLH